MIDLCKLWAADVFLDQSSQITRWGKENTPRSCSVDSKVTHRIPFFPAHFQLTNIRTSSLRNALTETSAKSSALEKQILNDFGRCFRAPDHNTVSWLLTMAAPTCTAFQPSFISFYMICHVWLGWRSCSSLQPVAMASVTFQLFGPQPYTRI